MPIRIIFALQKGGVGKTTSTVAIAEILAATGYRVLVVDADSQGNATRILTGSSIYDNTGHTLMEAIQEGNAVPYIQQVNTGLDLIPAEDRFSTFSRHIYTSGIKYQFRVFKRLLEPIEDGYDFVFIDVGPSLGDAMINAIVYADYIIAPMDGGDLSMDALIRFDEFVAAIRREGHTAAELLGIFFTLRDRRSRYEKDITIGVRETYGDLVFDTEVGRRVRLKEMSAIGIDTIDEAMEDYTALAEEIINRLKQRREKQ